MPDFPQKYADFATKVTNNPTHPLSGKKGNRFAVESVQGSGPTTGEPIGFSGSPEVGL
jgi:hypothetical protein